jgi:hypothetical protein
MIYHSTVNRKNHVPWLGSFERQRHSPPPNVALAVPTANLVPFPLISGYNIRDHVHHESCSDIYGAQARTIGKPNKLKRWLCLWQKQKWWDDPVLLKGIVAVTRCNQHSTSFPIRPKARFNSDSKQGLRLCVFLGQCWLPVYVSPVLLHSINHSQQQPPSSPEATSAIWPDDGRSRFSLDLDHAVQWALPGSTKEYKTVTHEPKGRVLKTPFRCVQLEDHAPSG